MASRSYNATRRKGSPRLPIGQRSLRAKKNVRQADRPEPPEESVVKQTSQSNGLVAAVSMQRSTPETPQALGDAASIVPSLNLQSDKTVSVKEAAFRLGKSEDAIRIWLRQGRLKGWQPGGRGCAIFVAEGSLEKALACSVR